jgi:hypothetical protein
MPQRNWHRQVRRYIHWLPLLGAILLAFGMHSPAAAQNNPLITVDENGNGTLLFPGAAAVPTVGVLAPDPGPGGGPAVLTYSLLGPPAAGDVRLQDGTGGPILDVVRFNPAGTGGNPAYPASLVFYSDNVGGLDSLGDTLAPPSSFYTNTLTILEIGTETDNGAIYTPSAGQPGFVAGFQVTYDMISDAGVPVPEPGSLSRSSLLDLLLSA